MVLSLDVNFIRKIKKKNYDDARVSYSLVNNKLIKFCAKVNFFRQKDNQNVCFTRKNITCRFRLISQSWH